MKRIKQAILIRKDLKMRRGKEIAQGSHASMAFLVEQLRQYDLQQWNNTADIFCPTVSISNNRWQPSRNLRHGDGDQ